MNAADGETYMGLMEARQSFEVECHQTRRQPWFVRAGFRAEAPAEKSQQAGGPRPG